MERIPVCCGIIPVGEDRKANAEEAYALLGELARR